MGTTLGRSMMLHTPHTQHTQFSTVAPYKENTFRAVFEHKRSFFPRAYVHYTDCLKNGSLLCSYDHTSFQFRRFPAVFYVILAIFIDPLIDPLASQIWGRRFY